MNMLCNATVYISTCFGVHVINPPHLNVLIRNNFLLSNFLCQIAEFLKSIFS